MRYFGVVALITAFALPVQVQAQVAAKVAMPLTPFEGTWRIDTSMDEYGGRPVSRLIKDGIYRCGNCVTKVEVPADGHFHGFSGGQDFDEVAVSIRTPRQVEFQYRKGGKLAERVLERVSNDGTILFYRNVNLTSSIGKPTVIEGRRSRVGALPAGAHLVSGEWRQLGGSKESVEALTLIIRTSGDEVTIVQPTGKQVSARVGGSAMPLIGDQAGRTVRIEAVPPWSLRLINAIAGEDVQTALITIDADGESLTFDARDLILNQTIKFVALKQQK